MPGWWGDSTVEVKYVAVVIPIPQPVIFRGVCAERLSLSFSLIQVLG
jgi:hypothetical protein